MKLKHIFPLFIMVLCMFFSIWAKSELHSWLGYMLVISTGMLCGSFIYFIQKDIKKEQEAANGKKTQ